MPSPTALGGRERRLRLRSPAGPPRSARLQSVEHAETAQPRSQQGPPLPDPALVVPQPLDWVQHALYTAAHDELSSWACLAGFDLATEGQVDRALVCYVHELIAQGEEPGTAYSTMFGITYSRRFPLDRTTLPRSRRVLSIFLRGQPLGFADVVPLEATVLLAHELARREGLLARLAAVGIIVQLDLLAVSYTHLTLPTNREV